MTWCIGFVLCLILRTNPQRKKTIKFLQRAFLCFWLPLAVANAATQSGPQPVISPGLIATMATGPAWQGAGTSFLSNPEGIAVDASGAVYLADSVADVVVKINPATGIGQRIAGSGIAGFSGDNALARNARLDQPAGMIFDKFGNLYIADSGNNRVRKVNSATGIITTVAGGGASTIANFGDNGPATQAFLSGPMDVAVDSDGNLYIADTGNNRIRKVDTSGKMTTVVGGGALTSGDGIGNGGPAFNAVVSHPSGIAIDFAGNLYIADTLNHLVRKVTAGIIAVAAGNGSPRFAGDNGPAGNASLNEPSGIRIDSAGILYIADSNNHVVRQLDGDGIIRTIAGTGAQAGYGGDSGSALNAKLYRPVAIALDASGTVYIADQGNEAIRSLNRSISPTATFPGITAAGNISAPQTFTISNVGNQSLILNSLNITGNFLQQSAGLPDCVASLNVASGTSCSLAVAFAPQSAGNLNGMVVLTTNAANISTSISLLGFASGAAISVPSVNVSSLQFNSQLVGLPGSTQTVTLSNPGAADLQIAVITISGTNASDFAVNKTAGNCDSILKAGASCSIVVAFTPAASGERAATLAIVESDSVHQSQFTQSVLLSALVNPPSAIASPGVVTFPHRFGKRIITLNNSGLLPLSVSGISLSNASDFKITNNTCGASINVSGSCVVTVQYTPTTNALHSGTLNFATNAQTPQSVSLNGLISYTHGDYDGDGITDFAVWRPTTGTWFVIPSTDRTTRWHFDWGSPGDIPVPGDYDGDGITDFAVWRPTTGTWFAIPSTDKTTRWHFDWGSRGDTPVVGDYDGDGITDFAVWRPTTGTWFVIPSTDRTTRWHFDWGSPGDIPVPGDYDGDGITDFAVWRPSTGTWFVIPSTDRTTRWHFDWGSPGDIPVPGDYDGDGITDFAVWRPSTGTWFVIPSTDRTTRWHFDWGSPGDIPVPGDYDGDGITDFAVWRPSTGNWFVIPSSLPTSRLAPQWGLKTDTPQ